MRNKHMATVTTVKRRPSATLKCRAVKGWPTERECNSEQQHVLRHSAATERYAIELYSTRRDSNAHTTQVSASYNTMEATPFKFR